MDHQGVPAALSLAFLFSSLCITHLICITTCDPVSYTIKSSENLTCIQDEPCFTFEEFVGNISQLIRNRTILRLNSGTHHISSGPIVLENVDTFSIISETTASINCTQFAGFIVSNVKILTVNNTKFIGCGNPSGIMNLTQSSVSINGCIFTDSRGKVIIAKNSTVEVMHSIIKLSQAEVITIKQKSSISVTNCSFELNSKEVLYIKSSTGIFQECTFQNNTVTSDKNLIRVYKSNITLNQCELINNSAVRGRILWSSGSNSVLGIAGTNFEHNTLQRVGMLAVKYVKLTIENCTFVNNTVEKTGVLFLWHSQVEVFQTLEIRDNSVEWGVLNLHESDLTVHHTTIFVRNRAILSAADIRNSNVRFKDSLIFSNNTGAIFIEESRVTFNGSCEFFDNMQLQPINSSFYKQGGAIISIWSAIHFYNVTSFCRNKSWKVGGAINAIESRLHAHSNAVYTENTAEEKGGAVHLDHSYFICQANCTFIGNTARTKGGAIHATDSIISIGYEWYKLHQTINNSSRYLSFVNNYATESGGAISLEANAKVRGPLKAFYTYSIEFINNTAQKGTEIFVNDYDSCNDARYSTCFLQTPQFKAKETRNRFKVVITSANNKNALYGGLLDRCIAKSDYTDFDRGNPLTKGIAYFKKVTNDTAIERLIASDPVRLCYCLYGKMDCDYDNLTVETEKGRVFNVTVTAVDQVKYQVNATIQIDYLHSHLRDGQHRQKISNECSNLSLNVYSSSHNQVTLSLYAIGPCNGTTASKRSLHVTFTKCTCPVGFQGMTTQSGGCLCDCDRHIKKYITECNETTKSLLRQGNFWIDYLSNTSADNPYIIYHNCPYDYCIPPTQNVSINLNNYHGADAQCAFHRTGLLCSTCRFPLSLSIGSSRCLNCTADWPKIFFATIIGGALSGIAFVVIILVLNLTIAVGTLNGFVFYINIVASNNIIYRSSGSVSNIVLSVFIAWFNLELGIDTCFFKGLDTYSKVWLQFAFPIYLIVVLFAIIAISRCSSRFAQLIGKRNPVATLATIILVSYMKFLRNIIDILSFAVIRYPDGSQELSWLPDANIKYFQGKHIPLFLAAVFVVVIGLSYTIFLLLWQCLLPASNYRLLRWIRNTRFNSFMEVNFAAYRPKHRYWMGLLLLIRIILYLEIAYNYREPRASLLAAALTAASLLLLMIVVGGKIYRKKLVGCLNSFCYFNLLMLSVSQLYWQNNTKGQRISAEISVGAAFALLIGILVYHTVITLLEISHINRLKTSIIQRVSKLGKTHLPIGHQETDLIMQIMPSQTGPTFTEVGLSDSREAYINEYGEERDTSENAPPLSTAVSEWEERNSLREPLLLEEQQS